MPSAQSRCITLDAISRAYWSQGEFYIRGFHAVLAVHFWEEAYDGTSFLTASGGATNSPSRGLSVHFSSDGQCIASTVVQATPRLLVGGKNQSAPPMRWIWRSLLVAASEEVRRVASGGLPVLIACTYYKVNHTICVRVARRVLSRGAGHGVEFRF